MIMYETKEYLIELVNDLSSDKLLALYSYANYLKQMPDDKLILEKDDLHDLQSIIKNDKYYSKNELMDELSKND